VLWIRIGFNADLGPAFYLNADLDPETDSWSETNTDLQQIRIHNTALLHGWLV
jgi:hypothetical protein